MPDPRPSTSPTGEPRRRWAYVTEEDMETGEDVRRRVQVVYHLGIPGYEVRYTDNCSGCTEYGDYGSQYGPFGCEECGYTGKRRRREWVPLPAYYDDYFRVSRRLWRRRDAAQRRKERVHA